MIYKEGGNGWLRFLAVVAILLATAASLYARGAKEDSVLSRADELIADKAYDDAIQLLTEYLRTNSDHFGEAQARLQKIVRLREQYNEIANRLLDTLEAEPENSEKILELSQELLTIESPSNPTVRHFLDQIMYLAEFNINRKRLEAILAAGREQLGQNDFSRALATYASGLDIYQAKYFSSGYGPEAEAVASRGIQIINESIRSYNALANGFASAAGSLQAYKGAVPPFQAAMLPGFAELFPHLNNLIELRNGLYEVRRSFDAQLITLQRDFDIVGDSSFLSFADRLVTGPTGNVEGMTGTLERFWRHWIEPVDAVLSGLVNSSYNEGYNAIVNRDFSGSLPAFDVAGAVTAAALDMTMAWDAFLKTGTGRNYFIYGESINAEKAWDYLKYRAIDRAAYSLREAGAIGERGTVLENADLSVFASWQRGAVEASAAISEEQGIRRSLQAVINEMNALENKIGSELEIVRNYQEHLAEEHGQTAIPGSYLSDARIMVVNLGAFFQRREYNSLIRQFTIANGAMEKRVIEREAQFSEGSSLVQGITLEREGTGAYTAFYPSEGLQILTLMNQNLDSDISSARDLISRYAAESPVVLGVSEIGALNDSARDFLSRLLSLQARSRPIMASARTQIERAASLRFEGDRLVQAAQAAMARNNFDTARSNLTRATEQYNASLAIQESSSLRTQWDTQVIRLGGEIDSAENVIVVRDVRNYVDSARTNYYAGNMEQAEELLVRAQNRWQVTNVTEQPEVIYWLNLVRGALSLQSGRTIAPTAPLYGEMSQLLSDAKRNYDEGVRLLAAGQRQQGLAKFSEAMEKTRAVRLMFPMNYDARMLELRIDQQTDPGAFNTAFRQRLNEAIAGTRPNVRSVQSFAELQNLADINPGYPGLQAILVQAEIDMGYRPPPPDPRDLARSAELTRSAQANVNSREVTRYVAAQVQLEEAIKLNPNNAQASLLLDEVSILLTGTGRFVLSSVVQDQYNVAAQMFNQGNYLRARAIVEQLLQNPENQKSTLILTLKRRIDAVQ